MDEFKNKTTVIKQIVNNDESMKHRVVEEAHNLELQQLAKLLNVFA